MEFVCKCNNCDSLLIDTNPQVGAKQINTDSLKLDEIVSIEDMRACPNCETDEFLTDLDNLGLAKEIWSKLDNICVDEDDCIDSPFMQFEVGTENTEIWLWLEEEFDISVAKDLMNL